MKKRLLSVALIAMMLCSLLVVPVAAKVFPDTAGHWAQSAINTWSDRGVVNGDDAGNFRPGDPITRAETAKLIDNLIGFQKTSNKKFSDVAADAWYAPSVTKLYAAEVITGYEDGTIRPGNSISRQEAAVIIGRAFAIETKKVDLGILAQFGDSNLIQDWAKPVVAFMAEKGFIQGDDTGNFRPGDPITRAEVVTILNNMVGIYADGSQSTYTGDYGTKIAIVKAPTVFNGVTLGGAVVCGTVKGKVNFNSGSKVNGCVCNWSANASISTAGAMVASTANKNGGSISAGGNFNAGYGGGISGGGTSGGTSGGASGGTSGGTSGGSSTQYSVTYYANGGTWSNLTYQVVVTYNPGNSYALRLPQNPTRDSYVFAGWYTDQTAANTLNSARKMDLTETVSNTSCKQLYAGWKKPSGLYGTIAVATGDNVANRGKSADELMDNITLKETAVDAYQAKGGLRYVTGYTNSPTLSQEGNFLALTYILPDNLNTPSKVTLTSGFSDDSHESVYNGFTAENKTYTRVFEITASDLSKDIIFHVDLDGSGLNLGTITVDLSELIRYEFRTVTSLEEFNAALADASAEKITVANTLTLASGTYAPAEGQMIKEVVLQQPLLLAKDSTVTIKNLIINIDGTMETMIANATEIPTIDLVDETPGDETPGDEITPEPPTPVVTRAAALNLEQLSVNTGGLGYVLHEIQVDSLVVKNSIFHHNTADPATAIAIGTLSEGDTVLLQDNAFNNYAVALEYKDITALNSGNNLLKGTAFLNNVTDIKLHVQDIIPNIAYNYFDDAPVLAGPEGAITNYYGPLYMDATFEDSNLSENLHDAYIFVDGVYQGKLSALSALELTFATEDTPCEILVVPGDIRDTAVTINETAGETASLLKSELPTDLVIKVGDGTAKTIAVSERAPLE